MQPNKIRDVLVEKKSGKNQRTDFFYFDILNSFHMIVEFIFFFNSFYLNQKDSLTSFH